MGNLFRAVALVVFGIVSAVIIRPAGGAAADVAGVTKWEYQVVLGDNFVRAMGAEGLSLADAVTNPEKMELLLNKTYGQAGWELCAFTRHGLVFKRMVNRENR